MGNKYFRVSSHVSNPNNHRLEFWSRSYSTYRLLYGQITLMEVIECLVGSRNGDPTFVGRLFISLDEIKSSTSSIPNFIHSDGVRESIQNEQFYTTTSILCYLQNVQDVVDCFFTWTSYELWARRIPRGMDSKAFFCEYLVQLGAPDSVWSKLSIKPSTIIVQQRLASSRAFTISGITPFMTPAPQTHVSTIVFRDLLGKAIFNKLNNTKYKSQNLNHSFVEIVCDSHVWSSVFLLLLPHGEMKQERSRITIIATNYNALKKHIFHAWNDFPVRYIKEATEEYPHPPALRVHPRMEFSFFGQSKRAHMCMLTLLEHL
jgi:hypothetical protein